MKRYSLLLFLAIIPSLLFSQGGPNHSSHPSSKVKTDSHQELQQKHLFFIENKGQIIDQSGNPNPAVRYLLNMNGFNVQLRNNGFSYDIYQIERTIVADEQIMDKETSQLNRFNLDTNHSRINFHRIDINFEGANPNCEIIAEDPSSDYLNYYTAGTPVEGIRDVNHFGKVTYRNLYPGIDLEYLVDETQTFKYNFIVKPGADMEQIRMKIDGASDILLEDGLLVLINSINPIQEKIPVSCVLQERGQTDIQVTFRQIEDNVFGFSASREIPSDATLVIDPIPGLVWGTYYGGSSMDILSGCTGDVNGNFYATGMTESVNNIASAGSFQSVLAGGVDVVVVKFNAAGVRQWGTYYGGANDDYGFGVSVNALGDLFVAGFSTSTSGIATPGAYQTALAGSYDGVLIKFDASGFRLWGTYYGGGSSDYLFSIATDSAGNCYLTGGTYSTSGIATPGAYKTVFSGIEDALVAKFNSLGAIQWGTYYGGTSYEEAYRLSINGEGDVFIGGQTYSVDGIATPGTHQQVMGGNGDAFLANFDTAGNLQWGTYYGGFDWETGNGVSAGDSGSVYLIGQTASSNGISSPGSHQPSYAGSTDAFFAKLDSSGTREWGTYYGGSGSEAGYAVKGKADGNVYFTGYTFSSTGISTPGVYQPAWAGEHDVFLTEFNPSGNRIWGTYYGGPLSEDPKDISPVGNRYIYVVGYTASATGISTPGSHQPSFGGGTWDSFITKFTLCNPTIITSQPADKNVCQGTDVNFQLSATGDNLTYQWQVNSGVGFTNLANSYPYSGVQTNKLVIDSTSLGLTGYTYRCLLTNNCLEVESSNTIMLTVNPLPVPIISPQPLITESFENGGTIPTGWALETLAPNNTITFPSSTSHPIGYNAYNGTYLVRFNSYDAGNGVVRLKRSSPISTVGYTNINLSFAWLENVGFSTSNDRVEVEWSTNGTTWNSAGTFSRYNAVPGWKIKTLTLPPGAGGQASLYIAFKFTSEFGNDCYLDLAKLYRDNSTVCIGTTSYQTEAGMTAYGWTVSSGGTITSGSGTSTITVLWSTPGSKSIGVNYTNANGCKANLPTTTTTTVNPLPVPTISGPTAICVHDTVLYRTQKNMTSYIWSISSGGTLIGSATDSLVNIRWDTISSSGNRWINVTYTNASGCAGTSATPYTITVNPLPVPTISGTTSLCKNAVGTYQTESAMTGYAWTVSSGGVILSGTGTNTITVRWDLAGSQTVSVNYSNLSGCDALALTTLPVTVHPLPVPTITGSGSVCRGSTSVIYSTEAGMTGYSWTISSGGTITSGTGTNAITVTWNSAGSQTVTVNYTNSNGCTAATATVKNVTVNPLPVPTITGQGTVCAGTDSVIYTTEAGMTGYTWIISAGGTIIAGGTSISNTVTVTWNTTVAQTVSVNYVNGNGCTAASATVKNITVNPLPVPTITGADIICVGESGVTYTTQPGMTGYAWSISAGGTITGGGSANNNTATVTWNTIGAQTLSVNYVNGNGCTAATPSVKNITVNPLPVPTITGSGVVCAGTAGVIYTTETGMTDYTWTTSAGGTITAGTGTHAVTVTWNTPGSQTISVSYTNASACATTTPTVKNITVNPLPVPTINPASIMSESFENGGAIPSGWAIEILASNNTITFPATTSYPSGYNAFSGTYLVRFNSYENGNGVIRLKRNTPISTIGSPNVNVDFAWLESPGFSTSNDRVEVEWSLDGATWNSAGTFPRHNTVAGWKIKTQQLPLGAGGQPALYIAFKFTSDFGNDCYLDLVNVYQSNSSVCTGNSVSYQTETGMTAYGWTLSPGGTITSGLGTASIMVLWSTPGSKTIGVNYTNANGCKANLPTTTTTTVNPLPVPTISGPASVCLHDTVLYRTQKNMTSYLWSISSGGTIIGSAADSLITVAWDSAGTRWVIVTYTNTIGCTGTNPAPFNVTVNPLPVPTITGPISLCKNTIGTYQTELAMTDYSWAVSPGGVILTGLGTRTITVRWDSAGARSISVNYTTVPGCQALAPTMLPVIVHPLPTPTINGQDTACVNSTGNNYTTEAGMTNYLWTVSTGGVITGGGTTSSNFVTVTWASIGNHSVSVNYTTLSGCSAATATNFSVLVSLIPTPELFGPATPCVLSPETYSTQQMMESYNWSVSPGGVITSPTDTSAIVVLWNTAGNQYVIVNYTTPAGCTGLIPDTLPVIVNSRPTPSISGPISVCEGTGGHAYTTEPMKTAYQWTLSGGGTIISGAGTNVVTVTWDSAGARQVMVNYTNPSTGCNALAPTSYAVTVKPKPNPVILGPTPVCKGIPGNNYTTQSGMLNYIWNVSSGNTTTSGGTTGSNFITITWNMVDTQTVSVNYTATNGCTAQTAKSFKVKVNPLPTPTIGGPDTVCATTSGNLYGTQPGMSNYSWVISTGGTITSGLNTDTITVTWAQAGARWVSVNYSDSNVCSAAAPYVYNVHVLSLPVPTITGPATACEGSTGKTYTTQTGMTNYLWAVSNGGTITAGGSDSVNFVTITWDSAGAQTVSVGYTNASECTTGTPTVFNVTVNPLPLPSITGADTACANAGNYAYTTETGMTGYQWTTSASGMITSGMGTSQVQVTWLGTGTQWVSVSYTNGNGCSAAIPSTLTVLVEGSPGQMGPITGSDSICGVATGISYSTNPITNATSYNWSVPPGAIITSGAGTTSILVDYPTTATSGNMTVTASNACGNGAPSPPLQISVTQIPATPVITLIGNVLQSNIPDGNQWFLNDTLIPGATGTTFHVLEEGDYWDKVIINGCASDTSNHIYVIITGIENPVGKGISLYPNPNDGTFTLRFNQTTDESYVVMVVNQLGLKVTEKELLVKPGNSEHQIDLRPLPIGVYTILISGETKRVVKKIVVK